MNILMLVTAKQRVIGDIKPLNETARFARVTSVGHDDDTKMEAKIWRLPELAALEVPEEVGRELLALGYAERYS